MTLDDHVYMIKKCQICKICAVKPMQDTFLYIYIYVYTYYVSVYFV